MKNKFSTNVRLPNSTAGRENEASAPNKRKAASAAAIVASASPNLFVSSPLGRGSHPHLPNQRDINEGAGNEPKCEKQDRQNARDRERHQVRVWKHETPQLRSVVAREEISAAAFQLRNELPGQL